MPFSHPMTAVPPDSSNHPTEPAVQALLAQAHADLALLQATRVRLAACGIGLQHLPTDTDLRALALLGDHERAAILAGCDDDTWAALRERNLTQAAQPVHLPTPLLRLLRFALPHLDGMATLDEHLGASDLPAPPPGLLRCPSLLRAVGWGQTLLIPFVAEQVEALRIHADVDFGVEPVLLPAEQGRVVGRLPLLAEAGRVYFSLRTLDGAHYRHVLTVTLAQSVDEVLG